jgi:DNA-binding SARP family transcriptional activator
MLEQWDARGGHSLAVVGLVKLGPALIDHNKPGGVRIALQQLERADSMGLLPYLKWWLRDYVRHTSRLASARGGIGLLAKFLETDAEFWRTPLVRLLSRTSGERRNVLLQALVKFANKSTVEALREVSGADVEVARKLLERKQASRIFVRTFGTLGVHHGGWTSPLQAMDKRRLRLLLGLLAAHSRQFIARDTALDILWPDADPAAAVNSLNQSVYQLRRILDTSYSDGSSPTYVISGADGLQLDPELVRVDVDEFRALAVRLRTTAGLDAEALARQAVDLVRGPFLAEIRYEEWVQPLAEAIHAEVRETLLPLASSTTTSPDLAVRAGCALMLLDEFDEAAVVVTARQLASAGRRVAARELIQRFAKRLHAELDEDPSDVLRGVMSVLGLEASTTT